MKPLTPRKRAALQAYILATGGEFSEVVKDDKMYKPRWVFNIYAEGCGDVICANDKDIPLNRLQRVWWRVCGNVKMFLFGWWHWENEDTTWSPK